MSSRWKDMIRLAKILEHEWRGGTIDRAEAYSLAQRLAPSHPELRHTLSSVQARMGGKVG